MAIPKDKRYIIATKKGQMQKYKKLIYIQSSKNRSQ